VLVTLQSKARSTETALSPSPSVCRSTPALSEPQYVNVKQAGLCRSHPDL
jgi:hypothetical protein